MNDLETGAVDAAIPTPDVVAVAPEAAQEAPQTPAGPSLDEMLSQTYDKASGEPLRGPDGKFVSKEPETVEEAVEAAPVVQAEDQTSPEAETPEPAAPAIEPPVSWSREMRDKWSALPPEAQQYIAQRESEAHSQISRLGQTVKSLEPVARTLEQYKGTFERNGMDYAKGVEALLAAQSMLDVNPRAAILEIARAYGVDLGAEPPQSEGMPPREVLALQAKVMELERQIAETRTDVVSTKQREQEQRQAALQSEVEAFAEANPYFNDVQDEIAELIPVIRAREPGLSERQILEKAYQKAIRINDATFAKFEADRKAKEAAEAKKKAEDAKRVGSLNVKTSTAARPAARSIDDALAAEFDRITSQAS
jgi:hypothetical protein